MQTSGYVFISLAWGAILLLTTFCIYKILVSEKK